MLKIERGAISGENLKNFSNKISFGLRHKADEMIQAKVKSYYGYSLPVEDIFEACDKLEEQVAGLDSEANQYGHLCQYDPQKDIDIRSYFHGLETLRNLRMTLAVLAKGIIPGEGYGAKIAQEYKTIANQGQNWASEISTALNPSTQKAMDSNGFIKSMPKRNFKNAEDARKAWMSDIAGMTDLKEKVWDNIIRPIQFPNPRYELHPPRGLVLFGPPGCGKTFLMNKIANNLDAKVVSITIGKSGSKYIHETSSNFTRKFDEARKIAEEEGFAVIFLDEADALITSRNEMQSGSKDHKIEEVNTVLQEIDNCKDHNILVVIATNFAGNLDEAATRFGRTSCKLYVDLPDIESRKAILKFATEQVPAGKKLANSDKELTEIAEKLDGFSNADIIDGIVPTALKLALKENSEDLKIEHINTVLEYPDIETERKDRAEQARKYSVETLKKKKQPIGFHYQAFA